MERKKNKNTIEVKSNNYSNLNNMIFNNMKNKKKQLEHSFLNESTKAKSKNNKINNLNQKIMKSVNYRPNNDYLINNNNKLYNNTFYNNKLETYNKHTINKDTNKINNKYVIDYKESIKRARNSSAPSLKQKDNETQISNKINKFHETSRNKKDEPKIFQNNKILIYKNHKKGKANVSYENQKNTKEKEKKEIKNKNKIYDISHRINNIKQNYNSKTNNKYFQSNFNNHTNKKSFINGNYKDNTYNKVKNKPKKSLKNKDDNLGINLNIFKDILEKQEKILIMKKQLKNNQNKISSRNREDMYSFNSYNKSIGENPILTKNTKNPHNKSYDNSLNNPIHNETNDKTSEFIDDKNIEIDNEEKVLNIKEDQLNDNETQKTNANKTYENNLNLYFELNKQNKENDIDEKNNINENKEKDIETIEIDNIIEKKIINTNLNMYNKNKATKNKEKNNKKDKKIRIVNAPKYNDYYFTKSSNIFHIINNNNNLNKTTIDKNNKSRISDNKMNKSKFNESYEIKKNNIISTQRQKVRKDLSNHHTINKNTSINKETKKKAINSSKIKKHNVKIKIETPKIQQNKSDNKIKIKKIDKIGCICRPGEISYGKPKINQDNYFNYSMNIDDLTYIGVCDGHGDFGHFISDYLIKNLPNNFLNSYINLKQEINEQYNKISKEKITKIFEESFSKTDLDLNNFCDKINKISTSEEIPQENIFNCEYSGSTCVSLLLPKKNSSTAFIANVGDSRVILIKQEKDKITQKDNWSFKQLSRDHKPTEEDEYNRIIEADGEIEAIEDDDGNWTGPLRVWEKGSEGPGLAMTRSLGDKVGAKIGVCCTPEVTRYDIKEEDKVFVLASDGLWEYISNQEVTDLVKSIYEDMKKKNEIDGDKMAKILYDKAVIRWREKDIGMDDITIICVILN